MTLDPESALKILIACAIILSVPTILGIHYLNQIHRRLRAMEQRNERMRAKVCNLHLLNHAPTDE